MKNKFPPIWLIFITVALYGTVFLFSFHNKEYTVRGDSLGYLSLAKNIQEHHLFSMSESAPFIPEVFRLPGYPVFLSLLNTTHADQVHVSIAVQCLLGVSLLFVGWPIFLRMGGQRGAIIGTIILALDLGTLIHAPVLLAETLLQLFLVLGLKKTTEWMETKSYRDLIFSALCWGIASLIKPIALFVPIVIFLVTLLDFKKAILFATLAFLLPASWAVRNSLIVGHPVYTVQGGFALLLYPAANAYAKANGIDINIATEELERRIRDNHPNMEKWSFEASKVYNDEAKAIMKAYPLYTFQYCLAGAFRILGGSGIDMVVELFRGVQPEAIQAGKASEIISGDGTLSLLKRYPALIPLQVIYMLFLLGAYICFLKGGWKLFMSGKKGLALIYTVPFFVLIAIAAHQGYYRFRLPLIPFIAFGAAVSFMKKEENQNDFII